MKNETAFDHVLIVVKDMEKSINFYKLIGFEHLETIQRPSDWVGVMKLGPVKIELMHQKEGRETYRPERKITDIGFRHIGFRVNDVQKIYDELKEVIEFDSPPVPIAGRQGRKTVFFSDPDGVELHFVQQ